eukprot:5573033-Ditylum_brightwellii.AAC.1
MQETRASTKKAARAKKANSKEATTSSPAPVLRQLTQSASIAIPPQRLRGGKQKKKDVKKDVKKGR